MKIAKELKTLVKKNKKQLFLSTHDATFLSGLVDTKENEIEINIFYIKDHNKIIPLENYRVGDEKIRPSTKQQKYIQSLFYDGTIFTEGVNDRCFYENTPLRNVNRIDDLKPYMPVNSRSGVPPGTGNFFIIHPHGNNVFAFNKTRCYVIQEAHVTKRSFTQVMTVDPYLTVHINPVKMDFYGFAFPCLIPFKGLPVPYYTHRKVRA